jgi:hypothetical protein
MCLRRPDYIPLLTERERSGIWGYKHVAPPEQEPSIPMMTTFRAKPVQAALPGKWFFGMYSQCEVLQRSTMFIALQNHTLCAPAERYVLSASRLHSAPNGAGEIRNLGL